ncbi:MAG: Uma2 family endonuclease, partial [Pseudomonadota bacterium]|nr:Uma2 family endonuclease [Pseudomonadota bacterium]
DELPCDDGMPMETERHRLHMELLIETLHPWLARRGDGYVGGNMFVYFTLEQVRGRYFRGPDVFVVLDVPPGERKSWVVWAEGKGPDVVIELLSDSTARYDKDAKKNVYRDQLRVPEYYWFDPFNPDDLAGFVLRNGVYEPLPEADGRLISRCLDLALIRWPGIYKGVEAVWLRWALPSGELLPTGREAAQQQADEALRQVQEAGRRAEREYERAEREHERAERLAARLRELGGDPDHLP